MSAAVLFAAVFAASAVEMVEALTIVLATGVTRGWRSTLEGAAVALGVLAVLVVAAGPALVHFVPLNTLRVVIGALLLVLGLQWLRKAILRSSGYKAKHDEDAIYREHVAELSKLPRVTGRDATAFTVAFKGVFLEGIEVVLIVLTLGTTSRQLGLAALAAGVAVIGVSLTGLLVARRLTEVPENAMKMTVGMMLTSFGTFWIGEGLHVSWPGADLSILALIAFYGLATLAMVRLLDRARATDPGIVL
ncbi:MAG: COG4280 domain-containing protein [Mycobacterium sp.]